MRDLEPDGVTRCPNASASTAISIGGKWPHHPVQVLADDLLRPAELAQRRGRSTGTRAGASSSHSRVQHQLQEGRLDPDGAATPCVGRDAVDLVRGRPGPGLSAPRSQQRLDQVGLDLAAARSRGPRVEAAQRLDDRRPRPAPRRDGRAAACWSKTRGIAPSNSSRLARASSRIEMSTLVRRSGAMRRATHRANCPRPSRVVEEELLELVEDQQQVDVVGLCTARPPRASRSFG